MNLSEDTLEQIDQIIPKYPEKRSAALMIIHLVQDEIGAIDLEACGKVGSSTNQYPRIDYLLSHASGKALGKKTSSSLQDSTMCLAGFLCNLPILGKQIGGKRGACEGRWRILP